MPYIIEESVMFDEVKGSLSNIETKDEISLPPTAACILLALINNDHSPVERSQFIEQVYTKFGFDLSNNTLNQYISLLRKNIRNLGVESEVIITVPRVGFFIATDVKVDRFAASPSLIKKSTKKPKALLICITVVTLIIFEIVFLVLSNYVEPEEYPITRAGKIGKCDLYLSVNLDKIQSANSLKTATNLSNKYLPCTPGSIFIYDINALNLLHGTGKVYLSRCTGMPGEDSYSICSEVEVNED